MKQCNRDRNEFIAGMCVLIPVLVGVYYWVFAQVRATIANTASERNRLYTECLMAKPEYECYVMFRR